MFNSIARIFSDYQCVACSISFGRQRGYLVIYTPLALLYHHESASRKRLHPLEDENLFLKQWGDLIKDGDPYYNPNLTLASEDWSLRL